MKKLFTLLFVFVVFAVISGCEKKDVKVQGITKKEILVGNCASQSGGMEIVGIPFNAGIKAYFDMVNANGGVHGRQIKFINKDDQSDSAKAKACVTELIEDEKVFAIVGHFGSQQVKATLGDLKDAKIPVVYFASGDESLYNENAEGKDRVIFPVQPILVMEGRLMVARATSELDAKKIGVIYTGDEAGLDMLKGIENQINKLGSGYSIVKAETSATATDHTASVAQVMNANVDAVIVATIQQAYVAIVKELIEQGNELPVFSSYNNAAESIINDLKDNLIVNDEPLFDLYVNAWVDLSDLTALTTFATEIVKSSGKSEYASDAYAMAGWIAGHFFIEGLKNHSEDKEITWASFIDAMESKPIKNPFGGEINFADGKRLGTEEMSLLKLSYDEENEKWIWGAHKPIANIEEILGN